MNKSEQDFLLEAQNEIASLKERIAALEARIAAFQEKAEETPAEAEEVDFTDVELGVEPVVVGPMPPAPAEEPEEAPAPAAEPEPVAEPEPIIAEPEPVAEPEPTPVIRSESKNLPTASDYAWRKDNPGMLVKNIRSGISLLDRAQFIGTLFKEDFALYDATIAALNEVNSLDEAVDYIKEHFPHWNLDSDVAYRFMMAIRKKLG